MGLRCCRRRPIAPDEVDAEDLPFIVWRPDAQGIPRPHRCAPLLPIKPARPVEGGPDAAGGARLS